MSGITLAQASTIVDVALKKGRELNLKPLVVAILDAGGHHVVYKREDKSPILRFQIATGKAYGALGMGMGSRGLFERSQKNPMFVQMLGQLSGGRVMGVPGGVLILDAAWRHDRRGRHFRRHVGQRRDLRARRHRGGGPEGGDGIGEGLSLTRHCRSEAKQSPTTLSGDCFVGLCPPRNDGSSTLSPAD